MAERSLRSRDHQRGGGRFIYDYDISNHFEEHGFWPFDSTSLKPENQWVFARGPTSVYIPQGEQAALTELQRDPLLQPSQMPWLKAVYLHGSGTRGDIEIFLDAGNAITSARGYDLFDDLGSPPARPASRSPPGPSDPIGAARRILNAVWLGTSGAPPWVRSEDLRLAQMPGRSRATR